MTSYLDNPLKLFSQFNFKIQLHRQEKFYKPGLIRPIGTEDGDSRDCIDIAVKIAFVLQELSQSEIFKNIQKSIHILSKISTTDNKYKYLEKDKEAIKLPLDSLKSNEKLIIDSCINALSNQGSLNNFLGKANNETLIRELQSSDPKKKRGGS